MFLGNRVWIDLERLSNLFPALVWNQLHNSHFGDLQSLYLDIKQGTDETFWTSVIPC